MRLCDGHTLVVRLAHNCVTEKLADSTRLTCSGAEGQVIVHPPAGGAVGLQAPQLAAWLRGGWRADAPITPQVAVTPLPGGRYRIQGGGWPEAEMMTSGWTGKAAALLSAIQRHSPGGGPGDAGWLQLGR